ncbi:hypothetical protein LNQ52_21490 [Klebsiella pneumoniae subsp. pneumoniae]|nr:hypothetical protein [Klebsiella pneumoniae subsp. pneumoniae]
MLKLLRDQKSPVAIMGGKSSLHLLCLSLSLVCETGPNARTDIPHPPCVPLDLLPAASGKGNISLPARVSKSDDIFGQGDVYHKAKESGGGNAWP